MTEPYNQKKQEEIKKIIAERKSIIIRQYIDLIKGGLLIIGAIILFYTIQKPESILNRKSSRETISRERAKLILDLIEKNDDPKKVTLGLSVIKVSYPDEDNVWINEVEKLFTTKVKLKGLTDLINYPIEKPNSDEIRAIGKRLNQLYEQKERLQYELVAEASGKSTTGKRGIGPVYKLLKSEVEKLDSEILATLKQLSAFEDSFENTEWINNALQSSRRLTDE